METSQSKTDQNLTETAIQQQAIPNNNRSLVIVAICILLTAIITGSTVYFWQKSANEKVVNNLEQKVTSLEGQISAMNKVEIAPQPTSSPSLSPAPMTDSTINWKTYTSNNGYTIKIPPGWYSIEDSVNYSEFMFRNCSPDDLCMENVVVIRFPDSLLDNTDNLPIETWLGRQNFEYGYYDEKIIPTKSVISVASQTAVKMSDNKYHQYWVFIPIKNKVLRVFSTITTGNNQYLEAHKNDLDQILSTFKFIN